MMNGSISFGSNTPNAGLLPFNGADNGTSIRTATGRVVLGNDVGDVLQPAALTAPREIPVQATGSVIFQNTVTAPSDIRIGMNNVTAGRTIIKINGRNTAVPSLHFFNTNSGIYKDWLFEVTSLNNGQLVLNDNTGNFMLFNRGITSISAPLFVYTSVVNTLVNYVVSILQDRSRRVFTTTGAAVAVQFNLPALGATSFPEYTFCDTSGLGIVILPPPGYTIRVGAVVSAAGVTVTGAAFATIKLQMISANAYVATAFTGVWVTP